ncbi:unnamed protein product [Rotaria magnacalcarata]|uniref:F-box domain-containing protein n=2 Tax=Rotaria magnacalcarata TaxID=392030 RepID=A0A8S2SU36_9BILA|nr:unnamed protein product [Rotaria magnacalcarata]
MDMEIIMEHSLVQLDGLPDEILMIIFKTLDNYDVLYSLINVNKRLNIFVHDSIFTSNLTLMRCSFNDSKHPLSDTLLEQFYVRILPKIHHKIQWLNIESSSMERILLCTNYPNLYGLGLYNLEIERAKHLFTNGNVLIDLFKNQILSLVIRIYNNNRISANHDNAIIFTNIVTVFANLQCLNFDSSSIYSQRLSFDISSPTFISSTLLELHVDVERFNDCLYLLDGRFNQLRILHINSAWIRRSSRVTINNTESLPNLKCFSLYCDTDTSCYDELIVPLLQRMLNLEKLHLHLIIFCKNTFIDGNLLKRNIMNHMPQINKFTFNIRSSMSLRNQINLLSNEDIQYTFNDFQNNQIISCVDYFSEIQRGECHIYSYPYEWKEYHKITNNFPGGIFKHVCEISLFDERPFEHNFFSRISQSFPFVKKLTLINDKRSRKLDDNNQHLSIIEYPHLSVLDLVEAHDDYIEQFLVDTKTCLPNSVYLAVYYQVLKRVTQHFTRNETRINCKKLRCLGLVGKCRIPKYVEQYFPHTKIL